MQLATLPKILLVDDMHHNLVALQEILLDLEAELFLAHSSNEALALATQHEFALVLLDVQMPGMDGIEVATLLHQVNATMHIPIIFVTAHGQNAEMTFKGYQVGAVDYLHKPIVPEILRSKVHVFLDLFRQKQELCRLVDELKDKQVVEERLLAEQKALTTQFMESRDRALEAARLKSAFLATMSHEIRTPMNGILGMTNVLLDSSLDPDQRDCAETIKHSADALLTILNDILDFSKIESGKLDIEVIDFDLRVLVDEVIELLWLKAQEKGVELVGLIYASVPRLVRGDPGRLRQILLNLVGNAIKFTDHGEVVVTVSLMSETADTIQLRVDVSDTGIGLPLDAEEKLFQPFIQSDSSTTRRFGGTGLGLAICKQLVELMGGTIRGERQPDQGSVFWFTIALEKQVTADVLALDTDDLLQGVRVCIVDDNAKSRLQLSHYLVSWGMTTLLSENGANALSVLRESMDHGQPCDLLILDRHMPEMDGLELARQVRADPHLSGIQMVMLTSMGHRGDATNAQEAGIVAYLTKPIHYDRLRTCLSLVRKDGSTLDSRLITQHTVREAMHQMEKRVLVAEDNLVNQKVVVRMLKKLNYRVDVVTNGLEAVEAVSQNYYDAVLMDCQMPEMDGYEATQEIRRREASGVRSNKNEAHSPHPSPLWPGHLPIIALTANAMHGDRERCLDVGMDDFISKPVEFAILESTLAQWIGNVAGQEVGAENQK